MRGIHDTCDASRCLRRAAAFFALLLAASIATAMAPEVAHAQGAFGSYGAQSDTLALPEIEGGFGIAAEGFPAGATARAGTFPLAERLLVANNRMIWLQKNPGSDVFVPVATVTNVMDPGFLRVSPDGSRVALALGYGQPLLVFDPAILDPASPPELDADSRVTSFALNSFDAAWLDGDRLVVNGGPFPGPPFATDVAVVDVTQPGGSIQPLATLPGGSGGLAVQQGPGGAQLLVLGVGYQPGPPNRTGEIRAFSRTQIQDALTGGIPLQYANGALIADNVLSGSFLSFDAEGNLIVGGGDAFGSGGASELGYAAILEATAVQQAAAGAGPVSETNGSAYLELVADPCEDDTSTGALYSAFGGAVALIWNPDEGGSCGAPGADAWGPRVVPQLTLFYPNNPPDADGDGVPDASDNAWQTPNPGQQDADGDGYANVADADFDGDGNVTLSDLVLFSNAWLSGDPVVDMDSSGTVTLQDLVLFSKRWLQPEPWN